ncbi:protein-tyrosine phosphatase [Talaromyces islandicus]|uniref:Protein-tyrosine phosphatase n=1 Tax=Talaromyces islandicus TaxID=28573 RepID=A0A0U1LTJ2_TALIS|nr:protein-tyrosine phosphatase [Talaromyces islandicus]
MLILAVADEADGRFRANLSTLQISTSTRGSLPPSPISPVPYGHLSESEQASLASSPETPTTPTTTTSSSSRHRGRSQKLSATGEKATRKARSVLGRVRALRQIASRKMAQSPIRINTNIHGIKRGLSHEGNGGADYLTVPGQELVSDSSATVELPGFLNISFAEARKRFEDLEWLQRTRIAEGAMSNDPSHRWALDTHPEVKARNRYPNVQAWANSRIHLKVPEGECDFINASPIVLEDSHTGAKTRYIATQGPKDGFYLAHFWHMVFHESDEVSVIVMLTQAFEAGKEKCAQYFPLDLEDPVMKLSMDPNDPTNSTFRDEDLTEEEEDDEEEIDTHGSGSVTLLESYFDESCRSEIRKLELQFGSESKIVWHYLFAGWADFSKPEGEDREALLQLLHQTAAKTSPENPRIVHCSAGVGRTGTFIALDHLLRELESGELLSPENFNEDPVFDIVNQLREQRMMMVYNEMQLHFIYEVLREQSILKLGGSFDDDTGFELRSPKVARLSGEEEHVDSPLKPELEPVPDTTTTAAAATTTPLAESPVDSPNVSDNDE